LRVAAINPEIEYLRAMAIILVLAMHAPLLCIPYPAGAIESLQDWIHPATGVDLFFVISGYLMGRSLVGPWEAAEASGAPPAALVARTFVFWIRRFYRLVPASALWLALTMAACLISGNVAIWLTPHEMFLKTVAGLISIRNIEESGFMSFFGYYWSLSIENQFYILLPLALLALRRAWRLHAILALCALNLVWRPGGEHWWLYRYDGLLYGLLLLGLERCGLAALAASCLPRTGAGRAGFLLIAGGVMLTTPLVLIDNHPLAWSIVNWAGFALVLGASARRGLIAVPRLTRRGLLWLGARSYSLYLCHIPMWFIVLDVSQRLHRDTLHDVPIRAAIGVSLSLLAADLTYRHVELPLQRRGKTRSADIVLRQDRDLNPASLMRFS